MQKDFHLKNRVVVVTISSEGLGAAVARRLQPEGCLLALLTCDALGDRKSDIGNPDLKDSGFSKHVKLFNRREVKDAFQEIMGLHDRIDILINAAELAPPACSLADLKPEQWNDVLALNTKGTLFACQEAVRFMRKQKFGQIINISSTRSLDLPPDHGAYAISKVGVNAMTEAMAKEEGKYNIRVNAVAVGKAMTDDVLETILFLISEEAGYITGQIIQVAGREE
ncbi:SDR family NAD(P)-dependent oxidoreductase [Thermodesulfobacteriota bacterium]